MGVENMGLMNAIKGQFIDVIELVDDDGQSVVKKFDRKYIGTDISEKYCNTARERCHKEHCLKEKPLW